MNLKKLAAIGAIALAGLGLVGCATGGSPDSDDRAGERSPSLYERTLELTDGRTVTCVTYKAGYAGGLSCDWTNAK